MTSSSQQKQSKKHSRDTTIPRYNAIFEEVNVLVVAFDKYDGSTDQSPSWQSAVSLPPALSTSVAHPSRIRITVGPTPLTPSYKHIATFVDDTFASGGPYPYQLLLILSVSPRNQGYWLERRARGVGYSKRDGQNSEPSEQATGSLKPVPNILHTSARLEDVLPRWQGELKEELEVSNDAGLHLSEYLFYRSLAALYLQKNQELPWHHRTTVACLHIPTLNDERDLEMDRKVVVALIYALIDSRRQLNGNQPSDTSYESMT